MSSDLSDYPEFVQTLLKNRGIMTAEDAEKFLNPNYERDIHDPFLMLNMERAVERLMRAIDAGEKIVIYSDYDCDGIPGATVLHDLFKKIGYHNFENYIPHRNSEGYGLNTEAIEKIAAGGATLMITVDLGITDVAEVLHAQTLGLDVVITDHHLVEGEIPAAFAVVNPKQEGEAYPDIMLCGAAVAWKLSCAILARGGDRWGVPKGWEKWLLDMVGLATIADMVPLRGENRALAHYGLLVLKKSPRVGLKRLLVKMNVSQEYIVEDDIGFMIGPRINAASRVGEPMDAFRLLSTTDSKEAEELAEHLMHLNDVRKGLVASMVKEARKHLNERHANDLLRDVVVIGDPQWKPGLAGLVAGNLSEEYSKTVFVWGRTESGVIKGSCRSDGTVNVVELMTSARTGVFLNIGGHAQSGGFTVSFDGVHTLEDDLVHAYQKVRREKEEEEFMVDAPLSLTDVSWKTWSVLERFAPFGVGNPKPIFLFENVHIASVRMFGKERAHAELSFEGASTKAISFFADEKKYAALASGDTVDLVATMEVSMFRGRRELRLRIVDVVR